MFLLFNNKQLGENRISLAPDGLEDAISLRFLELAQNRLEIIPNLARLTQLRRAYFGENRLKMPIEGLEELPLQALSLGDNPCSQLLVELSPSQRSQLEELFISGVANKLPVGLQDCSSLTVLDVSLFLITQIFINNFFFFFFL